MGFAQTVQLRYQSWSADLVAEDKAVIVDLHEDGGVRVHRPEHWKHPGDCAFRLDDRLHQDLLEALQTVTWRQNRGPNLAEQVESLDNELARTAGQVFERSEAVLTVLTRYPLRRSTAEIFAYRDLDWDASRHPDLRELQEWQSLAQAMYALATDSRCVATQKQEAKP
ncbi:hypothetical protein C7S18_06855 [Ahniella affigens]|uniref:Uncharacterized protein n=1 Tax=Ahniella affigens TaxID=2021234 RepID=A0A2P1PQ19_9GAMM|nr:hypothetical protein C7S18_06855 [Ahniella affigens]